MTDMVTYRRAVQELNLAADIRYALSDLKKIETRLNTLMERAETIVKGDFDEKVFALFDTHPDLLALQWTQYTPYFNDGEPCEFGVNADYPDVALGTQQDINGDSEITVHQENGEAITYVAESGYYSTYPGHENSEADLIANDLGTIISLIPDEYFRSRFGDHTKVIVFRDTDGVVKFQTDEYDHD